MVYLDACDSQIFHGVFVGIVTGVDHAHQPRVDNHLGASMARLMSRVNRAAFERNTVQRGLQDRVLLRVQRAHTMPADHLAALV